MKGKTARIWIVICVFVTAERLMAVDRIVSTTAELSTALAAAGEGDQILLQPGTYGGDHFRANLRNVVIRSFDPTNPAVIFGGGNGLQLSDAQDVTISDLVFRNQTALGLNIDDGGSFATPSTNITIRNIKVVDVESPGNHDSIKMSGVTGFLIEGVELRNWGSGGSALDITGCHHGLIQNSLIAIAEPELGTFIVRPKGGSKDITLRANRIEDPMGLGRAIQAGGSTEPAFFRFIDGDSGYEADEIIVEGNVIVGAASAFSWVNIDGGVFHHNLADRPFSWVARILNENRGLPIVDTQNGRMHDNRIVYNNAASEFNSAVNVGAETVPSSYFFARNRWLNLANPTTSGSTPSLPVPEIDGAYGDVSLEGIADEAIVWDFGWGKWIVNANTTANSVDIANFQLLRRATPIGDGAFKPLEDNPLLGTWSSEALTAGTIQMPSFSHLILIDPGACPDCLPMVGDYNSDGEVTVADYETWRASFGTPGIAADGNGDGFVDAADYVVWRKVMATNGNSQLIGEIDLVVLSDASTQKSITDAVPEPSALLIGCVVQIFLWTCRCSR